jgi:hypothetical protein
LINKFHWLGVSNLLPFTAELRSVDLSVIPGRLRKGKTMINHPFEETSATVEAPDFPKEWIGRRIFRWTDFGNCLYHQNNGD